MKPFKPSKVMIMSYAIGLPLVCLVFTWLCKREQMPGMLINGGIFCAIIARLYWRELGANSHDEGRAD